LSFKKGHAWNFAVGAWFLTLVMALATIMALSVNRVSTEMLRSFENRGRR